MRRVEAEAKLRSAAVAGWQGFGMADGGMVRVRTRAKNCPTAG